MPTSNKTAVITGASGGIGYELAKLFARDRHNLVLVARSTSKLSRLADELTRQFGITAKPDRQTWPRPARRSICSITWNGTGLP